MALSQMTDWRDRGCLRTAMMLGDRAEPTLVWMTSMTSCQAGEATAEACCAMRTMEAEAGAQEHLGIVIQLRWHPHHDQTRIHWEEGTVAGCQQRRPGSGVARDRKVVTWELNHFHAVAMGRRDGAARGAARAMGVSRGRCFLRAITS